MQVKYNINKINNYLIAELDVQIRIRRYKYTVYHYLIQKVRN